MYFQSYEFLLLFLPVTLICYYLSEKLLHRDMGKYTLLLMSFVYYCFYELSYGILLFIILLINYGIYGLLQRLPNKKKKKLVFYLAVLGNLGILIYFKYSNFMIQNLNAATGKTLPLMEIALPIGISFITFMQVAFLAEAIKTEGERPYSLKDYLVYSSFFPYITSGPITLPMDFFPQLKNQQLAKLNWENILQGLELFALGLAKKVLLADVFGRAVQIGFSDVWKLNGQSAFLVMLAYTLQIYLDFSGYSDMAIGIGRMFNLHIPENFNNPYKSKNILEFWECWHITLTRFLTRYLYIPLGGNRKGNFITYRNTAIVFLLSGLWHGANWTFLVWGLLHGIFFIGTKIFLQKIHKVPALLQWVVTFVFLNVSWSIFRADSIQQALYFFNRFRYFDRNMIQESVLGAFGGSWQMILYFLIAFYICFKAPEAARVVEKKYTGWFPVLSIVFLLYFSLLSFSKVSTFVYFQF